MRALFVVDFPPEVSLPPMDARPGGIGLCYSQGGEWHGGFSCVGQVPQGPTCVVLVEAAPVTITVMRADPRYLWLEDVDG